jgi:hypothetical protein
LRARLHAGGILSDNPAVNPELASANHVMLRHCDANSFMSNLDAPVKHQNGRTSYARGHHILRAIVHELVTLHGMVNATLVVLGGSSSGAFGVFGVADEFAGMVRAAQASEGAAPAQVVAVPDGGFWADISKGTNAGQKIGPMSSWQHQQVGMAGPAACRAHFSAAEAWKCLLPEHSMEFIQTPLFVVQAGIDFEQSNNNWQIPCSRGHLPNCQAGDLRLLHTFESSFRSLIQKSIARRVANTSLRTGYFVPSCVLHIQTVSYCDNDHPNCIGWHTHTIAGAGGTHHLNTAVSDFAFNTGDHSTTRLIDSVPFPESRSCVYPRSYAHCSAGQGIDSVATGGSGTCKACTATEYKIPSEIRCRSCNGTTLVGTSNASRDTCLCLDPIATVFSRAAGMCASNVTTAFVQANLSGLVCSQRIQYGVLRDVFAPDMVVLSPANTGSVRYLEVIAISNHTFAMGELKQYVMFNHTSVSKEMVLQLSASKLSVDFGKGTVVTPAQVEDLVSSLSILIAPIEQENFKTTGTPTPAPLPLSIPVELPEHIRLSVTISDGINDPVVVSDCQLAFFGNPPPERKIWLSWLWVFGFLAWFVCFHRASFAATAESSSTEASTADAPNTTVAFLNGLRGVTCFIVVIHHFCCSFFPFLTFGTKAVRDTGASPKQGWLGRSPFAVMWAGTFSVAVFFVLSGHVVALSYLRSKKPSSLLRTAICRIPRMAIPVLLALVWSWVLASTGAYSNHAASELGGSVWLGVFDGGSVSFDTTLQAWFQTCFFFGGGELQYSSFPGL